MATIWNDMWSEILDISKIPEFWNPFFKVAEFLCESEVFRQRGRVVPTSFAEFYCKDFRQLFKMSHDISYQFWNYFSWERMWSPGPPRISVLFALVKREWATRDPPSTAWSPTSCARAETSPTTTELEASPSTATSSKTRTSNWSTPDLESWAWPMPDPTPTDPNFSFALPRLLGWMASMLSLDKLSRAWMSLRR